MTQFIIRADQRATKHFKSLPQVYVILVDRFGDIEGWVEFTDDIALARKFTREEAELLVKNVRGACHKGHAVENLTIQEVMQ